jgi:hypothetical protein
MLAQNLKTAEDLNITEHQRAALIGVLGMLERKEMKHVQMFSDDNGRGVILSPAATENPFNMSTFASDCGTVHCIAGWADKLYDAGFASSILSCCDDISDLFFVTDMGDHGLDVMMETVTVEHAAQALRNYLTTGKAEWKQVLAL